MREIKFRGWDKDAKEMVSWERLRTSRYNQKNEWSLAHKLDDVDIIDIWNVNEFKNTMMQYTGLKDNTGKEIYEGDIVKVPAYRTISFNYPEDIMEVIFDRWKFTLSIQCDFAWDELKILGNIYENPELLESTK